MIDEPEIGTDDQSWFDPAEIIVGDRHRDVDDAEVKKLAESMKTIGLINPLSVRIELGEKRNDPQRVILVAGLHRLRAAQSLGWEYVSCRQLHIALPDKRKIKELGSLDFFEKTETVFEIAEIDENLVRFDLTTTQQAEQLARRKELWKIRKRELVEADKAYEADQAEGSARRAARREAEEKSSGATCTETPATGGRPKDFAAETAEATGMGKTAINRAIRRVEKIPADIRAMVAGTKLDNGSYMDRLIGLDDATMFAKVENDLRADKPRKTKEEAQAERMERFEGAFMCSWDLLGDAFKVKFLSEIKRTGELDRLLGDAE